MMSFGQESGWTSDKYHKLFTAQVETVEAHGGKPWHHPALIKEWVAKLKTKYADEAISNPATKAVNDAPEHAKKEFLACLFLLMSDDDRYKPLKTRLHNNFVLGRDEYPKDIPQATRLLKNFNHEGPKTHKKKHLKNDVAKPGLACAQPYGRKHSCAICGSTDHLAMQCDVVTGKQRTNLIAKLKLKHGDLWTAANAGNQAPETEKPRPNVGTSNANASSEKAADVDDDELSFGSLVLEEDGRPSKEDLISLLTDDDGYAGMHVNAPADDHPLIGIGCLQKGRTVDKKSVKFAKSALGGRIKTKAKFTLDGWKLYLDSCASYHSCISEWALRDIHEVEKALNGHCNAGVACHKRMGYYGPFKMWFNPNGIANLLSLPQLEEEGWVVSYHTKNDWVLTDPTGEIKLTFKRDTGVASRMPYIDMREQHTGITMLQSVRKNFEGFTKTEVKRLS